MLSATTQKKVEKLLVEQGIVSQDRLERVKQTAIEKDAPFLTELVDQKLITEEALVKILSKASNALYVNLTQARIDPAILRLLPRDIAERYMAVPVGRTEDKIAIAMLDPSNIQAVDFITTKIGQPLAVYMASQSGINNVLGQYTANIQADIHAAVKETEEMEAGEQLLVDENAQKVKTIVQDSPVTRALSAIMDYAVKAGASDVHLEPTETELKVRCRVDGILQETMALPKTIEPAIVSRVKILSNLKIDEHRIPQDGQFNVRSVGKDVDVRVAVAPVVWGEQVVLRLLGKDDSLNSLDDLGLNGRALLRVRDGIHKPHGMIISSGPTSSGKSTTLYAVLSEIQDASINIITLEDPVERRIPGVNQIQVNPEVGLTFATGLRSILRQDPNVIMVGEIRDKETATLAVQAALTGHLVLTTIHTNSAAGVLPRLVDMGIEPFLIASTVRTVIGQRLVRRVCEDRDSYQSSATETQSIQSTLAAVLPDKEEISKELQAELGYKTLPLSGQKAYTLYKGKESNGCPGGYKGRIGIYEVYNVTEKIQNLLAQNATSSQIQKIAEEEGMITMKQDGYLKALNGLTTMQEVARVAADF